MNLHDMIPDININHSYRDFVYKVHSSLIISLSPFSFPVNLIFFLEIIFQDGLNDGEIVLIDTSLYLQSLALNTSFFYLYIGEQCTHYDPLYDPRWPPVLQQHVADSGADGVAYNWRIH